MRCSHYPSKCPSCKAATDIIFGNKLGPDEIVCKACGWKRSLLVSTVLSTETKIAMVMRKMMRGNDKQGKSAQKRV
jgi:hypothetical protein